MSELPFRIRPAIRREWIRRREKTFPSDQAFLRAGVAGAYLPPIRLEVPHLPQAQLSLSVAQCVAMVLRHAGRIAHPEWIASLLGTDDTGTTPGRRLKWLRAWGVQAEFPKNLQFYRDGALALNQQLGAGEARLVYRWEEPWLRYVGQALRDGIPPILFVDLGQLYPAWRGFHQRHAVVLSGGEGRYAWLQDPARESAPLRVGVSRLMDALLPGEPLAALLTPMPDSSSAGDADA